MLLGVVYVFLFVFVAVGGAATYLLLNPPSDLIRRQITDAVKAKTGRDLVINGAAGFTFFPAIGVSLKDVTLSGPPGVPGQFVQIEALDVSLKALALLNRRAEVKRLVLTKPVFDLRVDKNGRNNWDFAAAATPTRYAAFVSRANASDAPILVAENEETARAKDLENIQLNDVRIEEATFRFTDERSGKVQQVSPVSLRFKLDSLASPLEASGSFVWQGQPVTFDSKLTTVEDVLGKKPARLAFNVRNELITASYDGGVLVKDGAYLEGDVKADAQSTRALASWFGTALPPVTGFGPLSIKGTLKTAGNVTSFSNAEFGLDGATAKGTINVKTGAPRPSFGADLAISELDLNKYLTTAVTDDGGKQEAQPLDGNPPSPPPATPNNSGRQPDDIEKLLNSHGSKVYGALQRAGWSSEALNTTLLGVADGDAKLRVASLRFKNIAIGQSDLRLALKNHVMNATFDDIALYEGHARGTINVDGSAGAGVTVATNMTLDGISALPFLKDAAGFDHVAGNANVGLELAATGTNQLQLVEGLNGKASFRFSDGAVVGFNLPGAIRRISKGDFSGLKATPAEKTDFSELNATFKITNGVAENHDLALVSPLVRVSGGGTVHLPERTIDYTVKPKLVASLEGQQSTAGLLKGIEVPVRITGSLDKPAYKVDINGALNSPGTAETIKQIGEHFKGKNAGEIVDELFGKKDGSSDGGKSSAKDFLNKLFKKKDDE